MTTTTTMRKTKANSLTCQELKHLFEGMVGADFLYYAYEPQYQPGRTLFRSAIKGIRLSEHFTSADKFLAKWQATITSQGEGKVPKSRFLSEINFSQKIDYGRQASSYL